MESVLGTPGATTIVDGMNTFLPPTTVVTTWITRPFASDSDFSWCIAPAAPASARASAAAAQNATCAFRMTSPFCLRAITLS
jgi:hypothetical protein